MTSNITEDVEETGVENEFCLYYSESLAKVKEISSVLSVEKYIQPKGYWQPHIFPFDSTYAWNVDNFGPFIYLKQEKLFH
ncbi:MAG: hypothetical protein IPH88_01965 [Bacteroidales bacterium]|nr:hypothetical protein [Bacteroidales bacterium]